jgi:two-component system NtrC family sensor kinase
MNTAATAPRRFGWVPLASVTIMLAAVLLYLQLKSGSAAPETYFSNLSLLAQVKQLDAQWEVDAMKSRIGLNQDYDPLVEPVQDMGSLPMQLRRLAEGREAGGDKLAASVAAYQRAFQEKIGFVESFKSHNAVLQNSVAFLPQAARDIGVGSALHQASVDILLATLIHQEGNGAVAAADIEHKLSRLERLPGAGAEPVATFVAHVRTVLREHAQVNTLLNRIVAAQTAHRVDAIHAILDGDHQRAVQQLQWYRFYLLLFAAALIALLLYAAVRLVVGHATIRRINVALQDANEHLESRVKTRTAELEDAQRKLVEAARKAGMAEVATNVLHNVGNVLNSVGVSAGLVTQQLRKSRIAGLNKAVALLQAQGPQLAQFLQHDDAGKSLPAYLERVTGAIGDERRDMEQELANMVRWVDHVKDIIATQQSYAGTACLFEWCHPAELIDEAIRMSAAATVRHGVVVRTELDELPPAMLDRHRVLQILTNLLNNARQAMAATPVDGRRIGVRLATGSAGALRIEVADRGEGIAAANLARIFAHGYTTRDDGHGFGLHSCALAAQEMGGSLRVHSEGAGKGATFTLILPTDGKTLPEEAIA